MNETMTHPPTSRPDDARERWLQVLALGCLHTAGAPPELFPAPAAPAGFVVLP